MEMPVITAEHWNRLAKGLEQHHALFYQCWAMGKPIFTTEIDTAAVRFDQAGDYLAFLFNPMFWTMLDDYNRTFVISHECLHVTLNHGARTSSAGRQNDEVVNHMLDVVVNHTLVENFGFDRDKIMDWKNLCWVDTVFPKKLQLSTSQSFEYYYNMVPQARSNFGGAKPLDNHGKFRKAGFEDAIEKLNKSMSQEDKQTLGPLLSKHFAKDPKKPEGTGCWTMVNVGPPKVKRKWETVIQKWSQRYMKRDQQDKEQWTRQSRRLACIDSRLLLPTDAQMDHLKRDRHPVWFYLDTSGSCWNFKDRFFTAAMSLSPKHFDVRVFCFDEAVQETPLQSKKVYGGGGTSFSCIEDHIQRTIKDEGTAYPEAVWLLTDGVGNAVHPAKPQNWYWFLTFNHRRFIPPESKVYNLTDFE
jgi:predicted metal-dependent peptidase